jgi:hypothetical protein
MDVLHQDNGPGNDREEEEEQQDQLHDKSRVNDHVEKRTMKIPPQIHRGNG